MGDLRNKLAKQAVMRALMARAKARERPPAAPPRCQCGLTPDEVPAFWSYKGGHFDPGQFYCPACAPHWMLRYMLSSTVNNPDAYLPGDAPDGR